MSTDQAKTDSTQMQWPEIRGKIKQKWNKFADTDVDGFKGNMQLISEKLQKTYGYTKDKADQESSEFQKTLAPTVTPVEKAKPN
jgi:uncharacterized protein YjbJ (UPF0337 family)